MSGLMTITVGVEEAKNIGREDLTPFAVVWIGKKVYRERTARDFKTNCPKWSENFRFSPVDIKDPNQKNLLVELFHYGSAKNEDLGYFKIDLSQLKIDKTYRGWFKVKGGAPGAELMLSLRRNRATDEDSAQKYLQEVIAETEKTGEKWRDPEFGPEMGKFSLFSNPAKQVVVPGRTVHTWARPEEFLPEPSLYIDGVESGDCIQGALGDCWFLGAMSIVATREDLLYPIFTHADAEAGVYQCKFFKDGRFAYITFDDRIPITSDKKFVYGHCMDGNEIWVPLMEKAYAKLHGCYQHLDAGKISQGLTDLTGECAELFDFEKDPTLKEQLEDGSFFDKLEFWLMEEEFLLGCNFNHPDHKEEDMGMGILSGHAYALLEARKVQAHGKEHHLLKVRNPWGQHEWTGAWSDDAPEWTPELRKQLNHTSEDDGTFWIDWPNFIQQYNSVMMCRLLTDDIGHLWAKWEDHGRWAGSTSGGASSNRFTWYKNPQFSVEVEKDTEVFMCLMQQDLRVRGLNRFPQGVGIDMVSADVEELGVNVPCVQCPEARLSFTSVFNKGREVTKSTILKPGSYHLIPSLFLPGATVEYYFVVYSYWPLKINRIPHGEIGIKGRWGPDSAGGCIFNPSWVCNPKFLVQPGEVEGDAVDVNFLLLQPERPAHPCALYFFSGLEDPSLVAEEHLMYEAPTPVATPFFVKEIRGLPRSAFPLTVMAVTHEPNQHGPFIFRAVSNARMSVKPLCCV